MCSIFSMRFNQGTAARLAGVTSSNIQNWIKRESIIGQDAGFEGAGKRGKPREFSFRAVMQIAVGKAFQDAGMKKDADGALHCAGKFAHTGTLQSGDLPVRLPGLPCHYRHGRTLLANGDGKPVQEFVWRRDQGEDIYFKIRASLDTSRFVTVDATEVFEEVCERLGHPHNEILDQAYYSQDVS